jgi:hypothetical protein
VHQVTVVRATYSPKRVPKETVSLIGLAVCGWVSHVPSRK